LSDEVEVTVIIPTKNEPAIDKVITRVMQALNRVDYEVIVVDKSSDDTGEKAVASGAVLVKQEGEGYGDACLTGLKRAKGEIVVFIDGDMSYDPREIWKILDPIMRGEADLVIGNRFHNLRRGSMKFVNKIGNKMLTWIINKLFKSNIGDTQSGFRAIRKEKLEKLSVKATGWGFQTELLIKALRNGLRIVEVPISYYPRVGKSKLRPFRDGIKILATAVRVFLTGD